MRRRAIMSNSSSGRLPSKYQKVEYIESTGTQYIDTNYMPQGHCEVEANIMFTHTQEDYSGDHGCIWGVWQEERRMFQLNFGSQKSQWNDMYIWCGQRSITHKSFGEQTLHSKCKYIHNNNGLTVDNTLYPVSDASTTPYTMNFYLFSSNYYATGTAYPPSRYRLYDCVMRENNILVRDFIPCYRKADGEIGLYDLVNGVFYTNAGTGTFLKGADVN